ncbi:MAG: purine-binding chemotaxis protein CheW [Piscirickettsiaceae bacterium]|nr:purine-binding chemotaxis protein CheW [Piscirickettsiaceae bacterium]
MNEVAISNGTANDVALVEQGQQGQYLTFLVGKDKLAIGIHDVNEIIEISNITRVPMTPDYIRGVINLRGNVVPVVDLSARLGHQISDISKRSCIVLVEIITDDETQSIGMLVDQVNEILEIPKENIQAAPEFGSDIRVDFIQAMGRVDDDFIILLEISRVLSVSELATLSKVTQSSATNIPLNIDEEIID